MTLAGIIASENKFPKVIFEERLSDGSDTANPPADHRSLFLGEDGLLRWRDSAGTITDLVASGVVTHLADATDAHDASAISFSPTGSIAATDVQGAIAEVASEAAGGGGLTLLEQHSAAASAALDFTTFISGTYDTYLIAGVELVLATNGAHLCIQAGTGAGPTWDTGTAYEWAMTGRTSGGAAATDAGAGAGCRIFNALANAATYGFGTFSVTASGLQSAALRKTLHGTVEYVNTAPAAIYGMWGMQYASATVVTGLRFIASSGNITSGTIRIYGLAK